MARHYKQGLVRTREALLPPRVEDYVSETNPVRAIDAYVDTLDLGALGFTHTESPQTGRDPGPGQPAFDPAMLLKLYLYGYLNWVRNSRRLECECRQAAGYAHTHGTMPEQHALTHSPESPDDELKRLRERVAEQAAIIEGQTATIEQDA